ncbi:metal-dependent hydrolase [Gordoniibacillus kamchatkensis]|uniref:Metal-dependent hydrolase n=1 Tax=Gordoniibacillus kamchatkensis TaxID=1590651 RepID=A0ABR5AN97_9BACL|nr:putative metal-dependent hydrolase [Paenibacillus sp. VKM B-2647]KIL42496.1 metal-dependent hydrolase [Paenibacillus sp. VKM B-2647]
MEEWSYPIGKFVAAEHPTDQHRRKWIEDIRQMPGLLRTTVQSLTGEQLLTLYRPCGWNVKQVVHHLADNDMNAYIRFKRALTEDTPMAGTYRQDLWAELSDYSDTPVETSIALIEALRKRFVDLLRQLSPEQFQRTFTSPTNGVMTLDAATERYAWHGNHHLAQIASLKKRMGWL